MQVLARRVGSRTLRDSLPGISPPLKVRRKQGLPPSCRVCHFVWKPLHREFTNPAQRAVGHRDPASPTLPLTQPGRHYGNRDLNPDKGPWLVTDPIPVSPGPGAWLCSRSRFGATRHTLCPPTSDCVQSFFPPMALTSLLLTSRLVTGVWRDGGGDTVGTQACPSRQGAWVSFLQVGPVQPKLVITLHRPRTVSASTCCEGASLGKQTSQACTCVDRGACLWISGCCIC